MQIHQLLPSINPSLALGPVAGGFGDTQTFAQLNMAPQFGGVLFLASLGTMASTALATMQAKGTNVSGSYSGASATIQLFEHVDTGAIVQAEALGPGDSNLLLALDLYRPTVATVGG